MPHCKQELRTSRANTHPIHLRILFGTAVLLLLLGCSLSHETDVFIPVEVHNVPTGLTITEHPLKGIEARIRSAKYRIKTIPQMKLKYILDLSDTTIGAHALPVKPKNIKLPKGIFIIKVNPAFLTLTLEKEIKKRLPIVVSTVGKPAHGFQLAGVKAIPATIILRGPKNLLSSKNKILTKPIDLDRISESFQAEIALDLPEGVSLGSPSGRIHAKIEIKETFVTKKFEAVPVEGKGSPYLYKINPPVISIEIRGPVNIVERLQKKKEIRAHIDLTGLTPGIYPRRAIITLPVNTMLVNVNPEIFTVTLSDNKK